jgi:hypothetical protein
VIAAAERTELTAIASSKSRRVLLLDPALQSLVALVCEKHEWALRVIGERWDTLLPEDSRPSLLLLGFTPSDENSLGFLRDLYAAYPDLPVAAIIGDSIVHVAVALTPVGGNAVLVTPTGTTQTRKFPARAEGVAR